jgi:hypothetical protein
MYRDIIAVAAKRGFNAIALEYPDLPAIAKICQSSTDPNCWGDAREKSTSEIRQRLIALLKYLAASDPRGGWGSFLKNGQPDWQLIEIGGHSQGGGHAIYIAKQHALAGTCAFSAPVDGNATIPVAAWLRAASKTSASLEYAFADELDNLVNFGSMVQNWRALGYPGPLVNVDRTKPPYFSSHQLFTSKQFAFFLDAHDYPVMDYVTPHEGNGLPVFAPVWIYACRL